MFQLNKGFTLLEVLITLTVFAVMLAVGIPAMSTWVLTSKVRSANEFYLEGFSMARRQAVSHNAASRIVLTANANSGQMDWQVDICFPQPGLPCNDGAGGWSTTAAPAANDPEGANGYKSVFRAADSLPSTDVLTPSYAPDGASKVYYTALGWVDTSYALNLTRIRLDPDPVYVKAVPTVAVVVTLAGMASKCDPTVAAGDSRGCPP
ncbi:pilus assembly FimT family protein [Rugamonas apoptosis]|uniref:Type II secretion system protein n=1 Tax=Rugamonas apoptosis TaxID=2758570 RepID=A0A7W2FBN9_9BURK|nr:type II secretion system protein [Rugamonas apoptosis]MBA5688777.1 type II secretion system protein [Rugamonas apoptosis]